MSDLIDKCNLRLMRTEECAGHTIEYALGWKACIEWMKTLPSAQPDVPDKNVGDMIRRQDAIEAVHNLYAIFGSEGEWVDRKDVFKAINSLPFVQPDLDAIWEKLSKVYNMPDVPDEALSIIGDVMLALEGEKNG